MKRPFALAAITSALLFVNLGSFGQDPSPSPTPTAAEAQLQAAIERLQREKQIAELELQIATARKGIRDAAPDVKATPNNGSLTISEEDIAREIIVYRALGNVNKKVAEQVRAAVPRGSTVAIFDSAAYADWTFYRRSLPLFKIVIGDLAADYCQVASATPDKVGTGSDVLGFGSIASVTNVVGQVADLLSYFRTETTMTGKAINVAEDAIVADLFSRLKVPDAGLTLLYPKTFGLELPVLCGEKTVRRVCCRQGTDCSETRTVYCSEIANALDELYRARRAAYIAKKESVELTRLDKYFNEFMKLFTEPANGSAETSLRKYINAEQYASLNKRDNLYYLEIKSVKAVGTTRMRKNLFFLTDKLDYSGGIVLQWTLFDKNGAVHGSGIETSFDGFVPPKQLRKP